MVLMVEFLLIYNYLPTAGHEAVIHYTMSRKGTPQLEIDGYRYTRQKICKTTIRWECLQTKALACKARATTSNTPKGLVQYYNNTHNHPPSMERRKAGELRKLKQQTAERLKLLQPDLSEIHYNV
uniref:Putative secreted protein n=1 Tax=Aedes albopictus TaxID=7160 RepID=A0A1W7R780_AEDAL